MCLLDLHDSPQFHCVASFSKRASSPRSLKRARALETCVYIALDLYSAEVILRYWRAAPFAVAPTLCRDAISAWRSSEMGMKISYDTWDRRIWKFSFRSLHPERCFCFGFLNVNETIILICHPHRSGGKTARISVSSVAVSCLILDVKFNEKDAKSRFRWCLTFHPTWLLCRRCNSSPIFWEFQLGDNKAVRHVPIEV